MENVAEEIYEDFNEQEPYEEYTEEDVVIKDKNGLIQRIQSILDKETPEDVGLQLIDTVQQYRRLMLDIATSTYINKPTNAKLLDSINTIMGQIEKSVLDRKKLKQKDEELENNSANFEQFLMALQEISNGELRLPNYGKSLAMLDPLAPIEIDPEDAIQPEELVAGIQTIDVDALEEENEF